MKKISNKIQTSILILFALAIIPTYCSSPVYSTPATAVKSNAAAYLTVSPVAVVNNPAKYLNKNISFTAEFIAFTSLGLDYKPAFRDGNKYIGILIKRDDVKESTIPLSEMKIFLTREVAEKNIDIEQGDKIKITGKVFSTALGDPWVDVKTFNVLTAKKTKDKGTK